MVNRPENDTLSRQGRSPVVIKGSREGLTFVFDEQCSMDELLNDLREKLTGDGARLFAGPIIQVSLSLGNRVLSESDLTAVKEVLSLHDNLALREIPEKNLEPQVKQTPVFGSSARNGSGGSIGNARVHYGTIRSGVRLEHLGDLLIIGDVNPGGQVIASGNIYVFGSLRGMAHAGYLGDESCLIAAVFFAPTQLRIATVISRSPDSKTVGPLSTEMEFAYLRDGQMAVDKLSHLPHIRL